jgi:hypothetical protein
MTELIINKINIMKNIIKYALFAAFVCTLTACEDMNSVNQEYLDRGESVYVARIDSVISVVGINKVWFKWWLPGDPRITKSEIRWVEGIEPKTKECPVNRSQNDSLVMETIIENFPEGSYTFEFINWDAEGHCSVSLSTTVEVIGDRYKSSLRNRPISTVTKFGNGYAALWGASDCLYSDLSYRTVNGGTVSMRLPADSAEVTPRMLLYDYDGSGLVQTTYYLHKTPIFEEIITVPAEAYTYYADISGTLTSSTTTILRSGDFDLGGEGIGFHDSNTGHDPGSGGANYRPNLGDFGSAAMDIEGDGGNIGYSNPDEWVRFTVDVVDEDYYEIDWYISVNSGNGSSCRIEVDGSAIASYPLVNNGNWSDWRYYCERNSIVPPYLYLTKGKHTVKFVWEAGGFNLNGLRIKRIDPNKILYFCPKTDWTIQVSDQHTEGGGKDKVIDGSYNSAEYWHSNYGPNVPLPHWAVIDMQKPIKVARIITLRRNNGDNRTLRYYIGNNPNADPDPYSPSWTKIAEGAYEPGSTNHSLTLEVAEPVAGRYLFLFINDSFRSPFSGICEIDVYGIVE